MPARCNLCIRQTADLKQETVLEWDDLEWVKFPPGPILRAKWSNSCVTPHLFVSVDNGRLSKRTWVMFCSVVLLIALACFAMASAPTAAAGAKPASVLFRFLLLPIPGRNTAVESACSR